MKPIIIRPEDGRQVAAFGEVNRVMLEGTQTGGKIAITLDTTPPGGGPPPHRHSLDDEIFLVSKGRISYFVEGEWQEASVGSVVFLPKGCVHCYRNVGDTDSQHWIITLPAGFETFFTRCGEEFAKGPDVDMARIIEISREHGIEYVDP